MPVLADLDNLMMAGKHISVTDIAGSVTKFMGNGGQHAIATAAAAKVCLEYGVDAGPSLRQPPGGTSEDGREGRRVVGHPV